MKVKNLAVAVVFLTAHSAFADNIYPNVDHGDFKGTKTRAEVRAELERAYAEGSTIAANIPEFVEFTQAASSRSREEVREDAIRAARAAGDISRNGG